APYVSAVSQGLITKVSLGQIWSVIIALILVLFGLSFWRRKREYEAIA
ncbi:MAG: LPXTG-motif cell wall-anchored protein, partial [Kiritimatiellia bacterium]